MKQLETGSFMTAPGPIALPDSIRTVAWNINRGQRLDEVIEFLAGAAADLVLLQEVDMHARRTQCRDIAREIARALAMNYVFGFEFEELTQGKNSIPAYHGQATLSRFSLLNSRILRFHRQSRFWLPRWFIPCMWPFQRRIGGRIALISHIDLNGQLLIIYNVHLESRGGDVMRCAQLEELLDDVSQHAADAQVVVGGDFNTDLRDEPFGSAIRKAGLSNPFTHSPSFPTTLPFRFRDSRTIDWILAKGPLVTSGTNLHDSIMASDHYPLSSILCGLPHNMRRGGQHE